ncbi:phosphomannomutase/phosphoglucomutase [bacterium]|nr:phosphomannomutase/phosphoglucomutase [bacterium]
MNRNIFRAYDIRGIADTDLNDETVESIGRAYGTTLNAKGLKTAVVGRDVRLTSERISAALARGILSTGMDVIDVGTVPTPVLYYAIERLKADGGVMVTGSHNPIEFNGLKMCEGLASLHGEQIQALLALIESGKFSGGRGRLTRHDIVPEYRAMILEKIRIPKRFKIVIDAGNGTAGPIAPGLFEALGCEVIRMYCDPDGRFPNHLPDPTVMKYIEDLRRRTVETGADFGIGYDGDADRLGLVDDKGRAVFADKILALLSKEVLSRHPGAPIVFDVKCSQLLPEVIEKAGGLPVMWKTGHSLLKAKMKETDAPLAGEMSGHIFFKDGYFGFDDGIYVSMRLAQFLANQAKTLSALVGELPVFESTPEIRIECPDDRKFDVVDRLVRSFKKDYQVIDVDGARVLFGDGWGLVRASNTQPLLVMRFEAKTRERLKEIETVFRKRLEEFPEVKIAEMEG